MVGRCWFNNEKRKSQPTKIRNTEYLYIMYKNGKLLINESERNKILGLYDRPIVVESIVITDWLSPDEKYCIFLDELYDIEKKEKMGNVWENFDNFKFFLKHSFEVAQNVPQQIKEDVLTSLNSFVITESNQNMSVLKQYIIEQNIFGDFVDWGKETISKTASGVSDFIKTGYEGLKKMGVVISQGDWMKVLNLLKKGSLYVARSIRSALYSPVGLILDAVLVASGVGIGFKMAPWAIVVALDIYEFMTGNYEDPDLAMGWRLMFFGIDILGLTTTGVFAKASRSMVLKSITKFGKNEKGLQTAVQNTPQLKTFLQRVSQYLPKVNGLINKSKSYVQTKSPMFFKFFSSIVGGIGRFISWMTNLIGKLLKGVGNVLSAPGKLTTKLGGGTKTAAAVNVAAPTAVIGTYQQGGKQKNKDDSSVFSSDDFGNYEIDTNEF